jgi:hypothetical protein
MSLKAATTLVIVCLSVNLVLGFVLRFFTPVIQGQSSIWVHNLWSLVYIVQMLLLNGSLIIFFVILRSKQGQG